MYPPLCRTDQPAYFPQKLQCFAIFSDGQKKNKKKWLPTHFPLNLITHKNLLHVGQSSPVPVLYNHPELVVQCLRHNFFLFFFYNKFCTKELGTVCEQKGQMSPLQICCGQIFKTTKLDKVALLQEGQLFQLAFYKTNSSQQSIR